MEIDWVSGVSAAPSDCTVFDQLHRDSTSGRALKHLVAVASRNMTVASCLDSCATGGYILGGVEFGDECCECVSDVSTYSEYSKDNVAGSASRFMVILT
jgi:hypothetical protein